MKTEISAVITARPDDQIGASNQPSAATSVVPENTSPLDLAAREWQDRKDRSSHPEGHRDGGGRWYPSVDEKCSCCAFIREPSRAFPFSLSTHCRSFEHIANLFDVEQLDLKRKVRALKSEKKGMTPLASKGEQSA
jgi:hypothetical protein